MARRLWTPCPGPLVRRFTILFIEHDRKKEGHRLCYAVIKSAFIMMKTPYLSGARRGKGRPGFILALPLLSLAGMLVCGSEGIGQVVSIDLKGNTGMPVAIGDADGVAFFYGQDGEWNGLDITQGLGVFAPLNQPVSTSEWGINLLDGTGNPTTVGFTMNPMESAGVYMWYDTGDANAMGRDLLFLNPSTSGALAWSISGLAANGVYNLAFYGQRQNGNWVNPGIWTAGAVSKTNISAGLVTRGVVFGPADGTIGAESVTADEAGVIQGTFGFHTGEGSSGYSSWSGLQIQKAQQSAPPSVKPVTIWPTNTVYAGSPVKLTAEAVGTLPISYRWLVDQGGGQRDIPGATSTMHEFVAQEADQGLYFMAAANAYGSATSGGASLTVLPSSAPLVLADPAPAVVSVPIGGWLTLEATVHGTLPIAYQWEADNGQGFKDVPGATNSTLALFPTAVSHGGAYRLKASNTLGSVTSAIASVTVASQFSVSIFEGAETGEGLDLTGNFVLAEYFGGTDAGQLVIGDAGFRYSDRVTGGGWEGNTPLFGDDMGQRNLATVMDNVIYGKNLEFAVDTSAGVHYKLQLLFHEVFHERTNARVMGVTIGGTEAASSFDAAAFGAFTTHPKGAVLEYEFTGDGNPLTISLSTVLDNAAINALTLEDLDHPASPVAVRPLADLSIYAGATARLEGAVVGSSPKRYQWQLEKAGSFVDLINEGKVMGANSSVLMITEATTAQAGSYRLVVSNGAGSVTLEPARVAVYERPAKQLVNFGMMTSQTGAAVMGMVPDYWNTFAAGNVTVTNVLDSTGDATGLSLTMAGVSGGGRFGAGSLPTTLETAGLLEGYDYVQDGTMTITLKGLDPKTTYDLVVYTAGNQPGQSAAISGAVQATTTLVSRNAFVEGDNYARNREAVADAGGALMVQIANDPVQGPYGTFNGLQIRNNQERQLDVLMQIETTTAGIVIRWPKGILLEAENAQGPYQSVAGNPVSPFSVAPAGTQKFYRVRVSP